MYFDLLTSLVLVLKKKKTPRKAGMMTCLVTSMKTRVLFQNPHKNCCAWCWVYNPSTGVWNSWVPGSFWLAGLV